MELRKGPVEDMVNSVFAGRRVFLTGHTGFKGGWLALSLASAGASIRGYALDPALNQVCSSPHVLAPSWTMSVEI